MIEVIMYLDTIENKISKFNEIVKELSKCNVDINELVNLGYLKFIVLNDKEKILIKNNRKTLRFIDMRKK